MYPQPTLSLSIGYHNIAGKHDKSHGCKINTQIKLKSDIEILSETWSECDNCKNNMIKVILLSIQHNKKRKLKQVIVTKATNISD